MLREEANLSVSAGCSAGSAVATPTESWRSAATLRDAHGPWLPRTCLYTQQVTEEEKDREEDRERSLLIFSGTPVIWFQAARDRLLLL